MSFDIFICVSFCLLLSCNLVIDVRPNISYCWGRRLFQLLRGRLVVLGVLWGISLTVFLLNIIVVGWLRANCMLTSIINMTAVRSRTLPLWLRQGSWWLCYNIYWQHKIYSLRHNILIGFPIKKNYRLRLLIISLYCFV